MEFPGNYRINNMIIYNVTINIENDSREEWVKWMKEIHIPIIMETGLFTEFRMCKMISAEEDEIGATYSIQYSCRNIEDFERYQREYAPTLQAETKKLFDGKFVAFRSIMEVIDPEN